MAMLLNASPNADTTSWSKSLEMRVKPEVDTSPSVPTSLHAAATTRTARSRYLNFPGTLSRITRKRILSCYDAGSDPQRSHRQACPGRSGLSGGARHHPALLSADRGRHLHRLAG